MKTRSAELRNLIAGILVLDSKKVENIRLETDRLGNPRIFFGGWADGEIVSHKGKFSHILGSRACAIESADSEKLAALYEKIVSK